MFTTPICWVCKKEWQELPGWQSLTGRCHKCRSVEGIEAVAVDGFTSLSGLTHLPEKENERQIDIQLFYQTHRFADDTGYYHQFHQEQKS